jgi:hypothetical protein
MADIYCTYEKIEDPENADGSFERPFHVSQIGDIAKQGDEVRIFRPLYKEPTMTDIQKYIELKKAVGKLLDTDHLTEIDRCGEAFDEALEDLREIYEQMEE